MIFNVYFICFFCFVLPNISNNVVAAAKRVQEKSVLRMLTIRYIKSV